MNANTGLVDRTLRLIIGAALLFLPFTAYQSYFQSNVVFFGAIVIGAVLLITALFGICPLYKLLGISTKASTK